MLIMVTSIFLLKVKLKRCFSNPRCFTIIMIEFISWGEHYVCDTLKHFINMKSLKSHFSLPLSDMSAFILRNAETEAQGWQVRSKAV